MARLTFLGTSASTPTKHRGLTSVALQQDGDILLFDCGEGTQRQMLSAKVSHSKIKAVFFSHFHADHILGFSGLIATMNLYERPDKLLVFGPRGVRKKIEQMISLAMTEPCFEIITKELRKGIVLEEKNYSVSCFELHHTAKCFGFTFKEKDKKAEFMREKAEKELGIPPGPLYRQLALGKTIEYNGKKIAPEMVLDYSKGRIGKKISYCVDTLPNDSYLKEIQDSDLLIHDSAFTESEIEKALGTGHSTSRQAAEIAKKANCKKLALIHLSARFKDDKKILEEAKEVFENTFVAKDLQKLKV